MLFCPVSKVKSNGVCVCLLDLSKRVGHPRCAGRCPRHWPQSCDQDLKLCVWGQARSGPGFPARRIADEESSSRCPWP